MSTTTSGGWALLHLALKWPLIMAFAALGLTAYSLVPDSEHKMVSITFDDGYSSDFYVAKPILDEHGFPATSFITIDNIDKNSKWLSTGNIVALSNSGWEIGSHSISHRRLTDLTEQEIVEELEQSKSALEQIIDKPITTFSSPEGEWNSDTLDLISKIYDYHVNSWGADKGLNVKNSLNQLNINRLDVDSSVSVEYVCAAIANMPEHSMLSLVFHEITSEKGRWKTSESKFRSIVSCIAESEVSVATISAGARRLED